MISGSKRNAVVVAVAGVLLSVSLWPAEVLAQGAPAAGSVLAALERDVRALVDSVAPSVVTIRAACDAERARTTDGKSRSLSVGSGVIMDTLGRILTTARVVEDADDFWVETNDKRIFQAEMLGTSGDIAVLQIHAGGLIPARFGDAANLGVGSFVAAVGNSFGYEGGLTTGEINGFRPDGSIQLSLGVSAGSSGGALVDAQGNVVGLIKAKISEPFYLDPLLIAAGEGRPSLSIPGRRLELPTSSVSLALPISTALRSAARVTEPGSEAPAYVGVYVEELSGWYATHFKTESGVLVTGVVDHTPAQRFGIIQGDVITAVDQQSVPSVRRFRQIVAQARPGQRMMFDLLRGGRPLKLGLEAGRADLPYVADSPEPTAPPESRNALFAASSTVRSAPGADQPSPPIPQRASVASDPGAATQLAEWDKRLRELERVVDSLQQELAALRRSLRP